MGLKLIFCDNSKFDIVRELSLRCSTGIEIQVFHNPSILDSYSDCLINEMKNKLAGINLKSLHGPFFDLSPGSEDSKVRELTVYRYKQIIAIAKKLNINNIVLHHGYYPNTTKEDKWIANFYNTIVKLLYDAEDIAIYFENLFEHDGDMMQKAIHAINSPNLKLCLDIGHINCFSNKKPIEWFEKLENDIGYIHMHNNYGNQDSHLYLEDGDVSYSDIISYVQQYCPNALCAIETNSSDLIRSFELIRRLEKKC